MYISRYKNCYTNSYTNRYTKTVTVNLQYNGFFRNDVTFSLWNYDART